MTALCAQCLNTTLAGMCTCGQRLNGEAAPFEVVAPVEVTTEVIHAVEPVEIVEPIAEPHVTELPEPRALDLLSVTDGELGG